MKAEEIAGFSECPETPRNAGRCLLCMVRAAVEAEREACAEVVDVAIEAIAASTDSRRHEGEPVRDRLKERCDMFHCCCHNPLTRLPAAIRARGEPSGREEGSE